MSGAMGPGMPPGMGQGAGMPQGVPPQILAMLQRGGGQGMPQGAPQGAPPQGAAGVPQMPTGAPQPQQMGGPGLTAQPFGGIGSAAAQNPNLALFARAAQGGPGGPLPPPGVQGQGGGPPRLTAPEMARAGRMGDKIIGHLTPGEIQVPPEIQSPKVLATLQQAFSKAGVSPSQFMAGSPQSSHNPATGAPEYSLWAALLPVLGAIGGAFIGAPEVGAAAGAAIGGGLGGAAGGLIDHTGAAGIGLGALGGAAGGYFGGGGGLGGLLGSGASDAAGAGAAGAGAAGAAGTAASTAPFGPGVDTAATFGGAAGGDLVPATLGQTGLGSGFVDAAQMTGPQANALSFMQLAKAGLGAGTGAGLASSFAPPTGSSSSATPTPFGPPMNPINTSFNKLLGNNQTSRIQTQGFNPIASVSGQPYSFYPQLPPGQ